MKVIEWPGRSPKVAKAETGVRGVEPTVIATLLNDAQHLAAIAFDLGGIRTAQEADARAENLEAAALAMDWSLPPWSEVDRLQALSLAGDCAWRARLFRARARELRS